jgi:hypothetical protein
MRVFVAGGHCALMGGLAVVQEALGDKPCALDAATTPLSLLTASAAAFDTLLDRVCR